MDKLDQLFSEVFVDEVDSIGEDTLFVHIAGWDSLKHVELIVGVESRFGVELSADQISRIASKRDLRAVLGGRALHA